MIPPFATLDPTKEENDDLAAEGLACISVGDRERGLELIRAAFANGLDRWLPAGGTNLGLMSNAGGFLIGRDREACRQRLLRAFDLHRAEHRQAELWSLGYGRYARLAVFALFRCGDRELEREARAWLRRELTLLVLTLIGGEVALAAGRAYAEEEPGWSKGAPSKGAAIEASMLVSGSVPNPKDRWWERQRESLAAWVWRLDPGLRHELFSADELEALWLWAEQGEVAPELLALAREVRLGSVLHVVGWEGGRVSWFEDGDTPHVDNPAQPMAWGREGVAVLFVVRRPPCGATRVEGGWTVKGQGADDALIDSPRIPAGAVRLVFDREGGRLVGDQAPHPGAEKPDEKLTDRPEVDRPLLAAAQDIRRRMIVADGDPRARARLINELGRLGLGPDGAETALALRFAEEEASAGRIRQGARRRQQAAAWNRLEAALR